MLIFPLNSQIIFCLDDTSSKLDISIPSKALLKKYDLIPEKNP